MSGFSCNLQSTPRCFHIILTEIDANWSSLQIIASDACVSVCLQYRDVSAPVCKPECTRTYIFEIYFTRFYDLSLHRFCFLCWIFRRIRMKHIWIQLCMLYNTHIIAKTHCTIWAPISYKRRATLSCRGCFFHLFLLLLLFLSILFGRSQIAHIK